MKQRDLGLDIDQLLRRQAWLQERAHSLLSTHDLMSPLATAGAPMIVGSLHLGLMVWPDIDFTVIAPDEANLDNAFTVAHDLVAAHGVKKLSIADVRIDPPAGLPNGIYLGPRMQHGDLDWQIDIWIVNQRDATERNQQTERFMTRLTEPRRQAILAIKQVAAASDHYHRGVSSVDIYLAVLDHHVETVDDFIVWLAASGRSL